MFRAVLMLAVCQLVLAQYGSQYSSNYGNQRYESHQEAYRRIGDIVQEKTTSWKAGVYPKPLSHFYTGLTVSPTSKNLMTHRTPIGILLSMPEQLPESFDARTKWPECKSIRTIRNQGCCGSCYAISAASTMSDRWCIHSPNHESFSFGAYDLMSCCRSCGNGCHGGDLPPVWEYWVEKGISSGGPYNSNKGCHSYPVDVCDPADPEMFEAPKCSRSCQSGFNATMASQDRRYGSKAYAVADDEEHIMSEIMTNGPVQAAFDVYVDFKAYKSGVYRHVWGPRDGGHAVKIIGWGVENINGAPVKYWLAANSWGQEWGENGYFRFVRGEDHCGIESYMFAGLPDYKKHMQLDGYNY
ncbi:cathepsin B-like [Uranotaenia lowii]|uniref:cathepsin B-like n=1 Tax=Uranotaenia lowii TaxID=190385 RepID=UPI00247AEAC6|nr:cathepsin B-like [Uranotaenia lowii]